MIRCTQTFMTRDPIRSLEKVWCSTNTQDARGKGGSNDANAEYIAKLRHVFDENQVAFQLTEMGKIDAGGGGTIAYILANFGMEVIDGGVAVLSMHSPWELSSKADVYEAYRGYCAFLKDMK